MALGRTIRIYLDDGSVSGIKHAEIVNWTGQAISSPRNLIKNLKEWEESKKPGVYFLFGIDEDGNESVYIGEAENVLDRLFNHISNKEFWNEVIFFTSKDENLTKAHVKYLESKLILLVKNAKRYKIMNGNEPQQSTLPRGDKDAIQEFIQNIRVLLGAMAHKVLEPITTQYIEKNNIKENKELTTNLELINNEFYLKIKGINSKAIITTEGIVVKKDSEAMILENESLANGYKKIRNNLQEKQILVSNGNKLIFQEDYLFTSPSQAGAVIVGYAINGRKHWCQKDGTTLKDFEEKQIS